MPKLSIIIPTFNSSAVLGRALDSIVNQTFTDWEVLVMDGVSTDDTVKIAQSYNDPRIRIYSEPDKGIYDAMNKGIRKANGEWLYFLGSDDWLLTSDTLQSVFSMEINDCDVVYGDVEAPQLAPQNSGEWSLDTIDYNRCHQGIFYKKTIFARLGNYNLKFRVWADYYLNLKWFFNSHIKKKHIQTIIAHYSQGGFSSSLSDTKMLKKLPWIKLIWGYKMFSCEEKKKFIKEIIISKYHSLKRITTVALIF